MSDTDLAGKEATPKCPIVRTAYLKGKLLSQVIYLHHTEKLDYFITCYSDIANYVAFRALYGELPITADVYPSILRVKYLVPTKSKKARHLRKHVNRTYTTIEELHNALTQYLIKGEL